MQLRSDITDDCLSTGMLAQRGWTAAAIRRFLGEPDRTSPNPVFRSAPPMRMFRLARVVEAEGTESWQRWRERFVQRSHRARTAAETRRAELLAEIAALDIRVPALPAATLARLTVAHRNKLAQGRPPVTVEEVDAATLRRWMVTYLRHVTTIEDAALDGFYARAGRAEATIAIRNTVFAVIAQTYPELANEARRQVSRRTNGRG
ncbi:hypothetical protein [Actinoplanes siamensis]|uniref:Uncharacterized protein n=1 Tax=Actinoplanes siamensis TaxID=1223317 RepID=A0A919K7T6_9ACTN|nr:hypothetical protein [Actinoplanes siamensis]GIF02541.1 hypothetical protein Asi03nite_00790 [Actinoplanes siamensis]